jgi:hypothetical protein
MSLPAPAIDQTPFSSDALPFVTDPTGWESHPIRWMPIVRLSTVAVASCALSWLVTATPASGAMGRPTLVLHSTVHCRPSVDVDAITVPLVQPRRSHTGRLDVAPSTYCIDAPAAARVMNSMPPSGFTSRMAVAAFASTPARSITPAFPNAFAACRFAMRATMKPLRFVGR